MQSLPVAPMLLLQSRGLDKVRKLPTSSARGDGCG